MIDLLSVFSRAFGGSCGSATGHNDRATHHQSKRVKSPILKNGTSTKPSSPRRTVVRFAESRDDNSSFKKTTSLIDMMASASDDSGYRDSAVGSREMLLQDDNPLAIMERRNAPTNISDANDHSSEEVTEGVSFESHISNLQQRLGNIDNARKRGLEQIGKFLPSLSFERQEDGNNHSSRRTSESSDRPKLLETLERTRFIESCPQCSEQLRYSYISSPRDLVDINEGRDSPNTKLRNMMPPYCDKCQAHLLLDHSQTKKQMIENLERWLEMNLNEQTKGKIIFISASPSGGCDEKSPRVLLEFTPKASKRGSVSFSFDDVDVNPLFTASSLTEAIGLRSKEMESERNDCFDHHPNKHLFSSDSNRTPAMDDVIVQAEKDIQIVSTESEEQAILRQYSVLKDMATDSITKHLKMHYELTSDLCDRCQMPMMKMGDSLVYCIVCPVIDESAKRSAKKKRKKIQKLYDQHLPTRHYTSTVSSGFSEQQNARLTALEEGLGFIYSPKNQDNDLAVSSCMSNDHEPSTAEESGSINTPLACNSQSSDLSFPSVQQNQSLQQLSYYDHVDNQYSVGIEYTYSIHQQNVSRSCTTEDSISKSTSLLSSASNIVSQTSTLSETQCPRNLPSNQMIWSPVNNINGSVQFSFDANSNDFVVDEEEQDESSLLPAASSQTQHDASASDSNNIVETDDSEIIQEFPATKDQVPSSQSALEYSKKNDRNKAATKGDDDERSVQNIDKNLSTPVEAETIDTKIARLSNSVRKFTEETRDDDESDLGSNRQQSFEGPLLTPHVFNFPDYHGREGPETVQEHIPCERETSKTVRVFGQTMMRIPHSECENLPPLFPPPNASPIADGLEQRLDGEPALEVKENAVSQAPTYNIEEKASALFPPPEKSPYSDDAEKCRLDPRKKVNSAARTHATTTLEGLSPSSLVDDVRIEPSLDRNQTIRAIDPLPAQLSSSRFDYVRETLPDPNQSVIHVRAAEPDSPPKRMDPPGKRLTKTKHGEGEPVDPPEFDPIESLNTPERNNRHNRERSETFSTPKRNNVGKPNRRQSRSSLPTLDPMPANYIKSKRHHHGSPFREPKSTECESSPRGSPFRDVDSSEPKPNKRGITTHRKQSKRVDAPQPTSTAENNVLVTIPSWVDEEIVNSPLKPAPSGDSSVDKLIQQIDDIEADFGSIMASIPESSASTLETTERGGELKPSPHTTNNKTKDQQDKREAVSPIALIEIKRDDDSDKHESLDRPNNRTQAISSFNSFDSDVSDDSVLTSLAQKIRHVHDQIDQIDSSDESDDDESIAAADSQEEMLQLLDRLNNAAESLRTFADFQN
eukprot:scaffold6492_cov118-Skeletonema_dohrnii-CCMP3373.AAC.3